MDKNYLLKTANSLKQVSETTANEYDEKTDTLISIINRKMLNRPDINELVGENNIAMMKDNHANHVRFMASIFKNYNAEVLVETVLWVFRAYRSHHFSSNYWAAQLNTWLEILKQELSSESFGEIKPYYVWMQTNIPVFVAVSDEKLNSDLSMH